MNQVLNPQFRRRPLALPIVLVAIAFAWAPVSPLIVSVIAQEEEKEEKEENKPDAPPSDDKEMPPSENAPDSPQEDPANPDPAQQPSAQEDTQPAEPAADPAMQEGDAATGDEATPPADDGSLESLLAQYKSLTEELARIEVHVGTAGDARATNESRANYNAKNNELIALVEKIETAAVEKLNGGDREQSTLELLTGIVINHAFFERDANALNLGQMLIDADIERKYFDQAAQAQRLNASAREILKELALRTDEAKADDLPRVKLQTSKGDIVLELFENEAPDTVGNFVSLVESGFYDGIKFHRVLDGFMAQAGCPQGTGEGGPGYNIYCECYKTDYRRHFTGTLSMAKQEARDTGGSQFFLTFARTGHLDGKHTVFGRVIEGMDVLNSLQRVDPQRPDSAVTPDTIVKAEVVRKRDHEYKPNKVGG